jgi:Ca2+-binding EF-hand superfamily protein
MRHSGSPKGGDGVKLHHGLTALAALLACWGVAAVGPGRGAAPPPGAAALAPGTDAQDLVFFGQTRPVHLRLHISLDGKPFRAVWGAFVGRLFRHLDVNGDGALSKDEAERAPPVQTLFGTNFFGGFVPPPPSLAVLDADKDGKVSREELAAYYERSGGAAFQLRFGDVSGFGSRRVGFAGSGDLMGRWPAAADALNERLFELLDANKDGKLSRQELAAGPKVLAKLDADDDEMLTVNELLPGGQRPSNQVVFTPVLVGDVGTGPVGGPFYVVRTKRPDPVLARQLLTRYGKGAKKLPRAALGLGKEAFARLDADGDGSLDAAELARFAAAAPEAEFTARLGQRRPGEAAVEPTRRDGREPPKGLVRTEKDGTPVLELGNTRVEMGLGNDAGAVGVLRVRVRQQYAAQFKVADRDGNGYLDEKEAQQSPLFRGLFKAMDRDGDGKLYPKEVLAYFQALESLQKEAAASVVSLHVSDQGKGLFDLLDADGDRRLGVRELRQLPKLVDKLDRDGDGCLSRDEIPRSYRANFKRGPANPDTLRTTVFVFNGGMGVPQPALPERTAGPLWFRKMDKNRDGDVSRREFLGTDAEFKAIDTDGDGLISAAEAEAYDKLMRAKRQRK